MGLHDLGSYIFYAGLPAIILFTILLGIRSKWYLNNVGRSLFAISVTLTIICLNVFATLAFGQDYNGREIVRIISYGFFTVASWFYAITLIRVQRKVAKEDRELLDELKKAKAEEEKEVKPIEVKVVNLPWWRNAINVFKKN